MHRLDSSKYLLFIEPNPTAKADIPFEDKWTRLLEAEINLAQKGTSNYHDTNCSGQFDENSEYRGFHFTTCGKCSTNQDYQLSNGLITNSLASYYLKWYRSEIPLSEWEKLTALVEKRFYKPNIVQETSIKRT